MFTAITFLALIFCTPEGPSGPTDIIPYPKGANGPGQQKLMIDKKINSNREDFGYLNFSCPQITADEFIDRLSLIREDMIKLGMEEVTLSSIFVTMWDSVDENVLELPEEDYRSILDGIYERENPGTSYVSTIKHHKHKHSKDKKKKKLKMSSKMAFGFLKFVAGSICCIIPIPAVQGVGIVIAGSGINDMLDEAHKQGEQRQKEEDLRALEMQMNQSSG